MVQVIVFVRVIAWLLIVAITALSLVPPNLRPVTGASHNIEHFVTFSATGLAFGLGYSRWPVWVVSALVIFACAIEFAQTLVPGRHARLSDLIVDVIAMSASATVGSVVVGRNFTHASSRSPGYKHLKQ